MQCKTVIDRNREEVVLIYAHERTPLVEEIERLVCGDTWELIGYLENQIVKLDAAEIDCFAVEKGCVYAIGAARYKMRERLYELEAALGSAFVKINQSCIVNVSRIERFEASFAGALLVVTRGGWCDYVSRRQVKTVKERIGIGK